MASVPVACVAFGGAALVQRGREDACSAGASGSFEGGPTMKCRVLAAVSILMVGLSACGHTERLASVPVNYAKRASVLDLPNARFYVDEPREILAEANRALQREVEYNRSIGRPLPPAKYLALSGGGDDGAFGAGLLVGWTERGERPLFKLVTGISTGALIAPFAFLGSDYDDALTAVYTGIDQKDILVKRPLIAALTDDALSDTTPLYRLISRYMDDATISRIATEYDRGRLLLIATTNLDAARPVIWNIGAIARSGHPKSQELIRRILLASASIPGAFPPVMFDVGVGGVPHQELHVDGGAVAQSFLYPPSLSLRKGASNLARTRTAYIIRNAKLSAPPEETQRRTMSIAGRAIATLIASNGVGDLYRMYTTTKRDGVAFNLAYIENDFIEPYPGLFDRNYMNKLFAYGRTRARLGYRWHSAPPGLSR
jgi:predicted acylesterase/phospholipase RssA